MPLTTLQPVAPDEVAARSVAVSRLTLTDFRCFARVELATDARPVVLTGPNGAGKTNLLEALSLLTPGAGLRGARLGDLRRRRAASGARWAVGARVEGLRGAVAVSTGAARSRDAASCASTTDRRAARRRWRKR